MGSNAVDLYPRTALVTGGSRGIGRGICELFAAAGARVAVHCRRDRSAAEAVLEQLPGHGHGLLQADLADPEQAATLAGRAAEHLGRLDIVVNNAGIFELHDIAGLARESWIAAWERTVAVNLSGAAHVIHGAIPHLRAAGGGHIVNVTSRGAFRGEPEAPAYGAAKAGLNSLSQSLALALAGDGIHVVAVAPGWVETDMTREVLQSPRGEEIRRQSPLARTATVREVAETVLFVVSGRADALTGGVIDVNCASHLRS
ncbi:MAG: SDR family oxidoreductase [Candidatus Krumholzibacteriia bacterium]